MPDHAARHDEARTPPDAALERRDDPTARPGGSTHGWIALPVGRTETGPTIAELVEAVRAAGGMVGGEALYDPRYEPEMRPIRSASGGRRTGTPAHARGS